MSAEDDAQTPEGIGEGHDPPHAPSPSRRALRTMAILRWLLLASVTALAAYVVWSYWGPKEDSHVAHGQAKYYCPMHPQIRSPEPGTCPICHMNLELIPEERRSQPAPLASAGPAPSPATSSPTGVTAVTVDEGKQQAIGLATTLVETSALGDRLRVPGFISAPETGLAQVRVRAPGFVEQVTVRQTGVRVSRGQTLAHIYSPEIYRAQEEFITATRWSGSGSGGGAQTGASDIAAASRRGLELLGLSAADIDEVAKTNKPIRAIPVRAPAAGFVTRFNAVLGSRAEPDMVLYEIADLSSVWVIASVHERDLNAMKVGMTARFMPTNGQSERLDGKIDLIEPQLDESSRTTRVRLIVPNREGRLRPGQFGEVEFELPASPGLFVPRDSVIRTGEHAYVYVATSPERFEPRLVRTGMSRDARVQVLSGLSEGDRVVTRGSFMLDSESRLQASLAAAPAASATASATGSPSHDPPSPVPRR